MRIAASDRTRLGTFVNILRLRRQAAPRVLEAGVAASRRAGRPAVDL